MVYYLHTSHIMKVDAGNQVVMLDFGVACIWPHEQYITWDYCPCLLSQQLRLIFERKRKWVHILHVGGGIWDCNSYVPTSLTCRLLQEIGSHLSRK